VHVWSADPVTWRKLTASASSRSERPGSQAAQSPAGSTASRLAGSRGGPGGSGPLACRPRVDSSGCGAGPTMPRSRQEPGHRAVRPGRSRRWGPRQGVLAAGRPTSPRRSLSLWLGSRLRVPHAPLLLPEVKALDVQLERLPAPGQGDALHHPLILGDDPVAGVADLPVAGTAPHPRNAAECCCKATSCRAASGE
jgi:hypothetical protein